MKKILKKARITLRNRAYRFSIAWSRIIPEGAVNGKDLAFYFNDPQCFIGLSFDQTEHTPGIHFPIRAPSSWPTMCSWPTAGTYKIRI